MTLGIAAFIVLFIVLGACVGFAAGIYLASKSTRHVTVDWDSIKQGLNEPGQITVQPQVHIDWALIARVLHAENLMIVPKDRVH